MNNHQRFTPIHMALITALFTYTVNVATAQNIDEIRDNITGKKGDAPHLQDIPTGSNGYMYQMFDVGKKILDIPVANDMISKQRMNVKLGLGYSCGNFDPTANVEQMVNQIKSKLQKMPGQFVSGATSAIASMPSYLLNKINPTLYNTITKTLDDGFDFFEFNFKTCSEWEADLKNDGGDYYQLLKKAGSEKLGQNIANDDTKPVDEQVEQTRKDAGNDGLKLSGGEAKGGKGQKPIDYVSEAIISGYNLAIGRSDVTSKAPASGNEAKNQIADVFTSPEIAKTALTRMYGAAEISLDSDNQTPISTVPANGIKMDFAQDHAFFLKAIKSIVVDNKTITEAAEASGADVPKIMGQIVLRNVVPQDVQNMRTFDKETRLLFMDSRAEEMAKISMFLKLETLKQLLKMGMREPNLEQSSGREQMEMTVYRVIEEIDRDLYDLRTKGK